MAKLIWREERKKHYNNAPHHNKTQHHTVPHHTTQHCTVQHIITQHNTSPHKAANYNFYNKIKQQQQLTNKQAKKKGDLS